MKNTILKLDQSSKARLDSLNSLKYTLLLDYVVPEIEKEDTFIESLNKECQKCCRGLFMDSSDSFINYNFFGMPQQSVTSSLSVFNTYPPLTVKGYIDERLPSFHTLILQHCILASYHAILTELVGNTSVTSYALANKIKNKGLNSLRQEKALLSTTDGLRYHQANKNSNTNSSSKASDFNRLAKNHYHKIPEIADMLMIAAPDSDSTDSNYSLLFSSLCFQICNIPAPDFRILNAEHKKNESIKTILENVESLTNKIQPHIKDFSKLRENTSLLKGNPTDTLYHYYTSERMFGFNLFYSLLKNIKYIENTTNYRLCQRDTISILNCCKELPNVFSRQYFLKYAFAQFQDRPHSYADYWYDQDIEKSGIGMQSSRKRPKGFHFSQWLEQYRLFFKYMGHYIIPVYEWCFLNMLLDAIEKDSPAAHHAAHLEKALDLLSAYMNNNYQTILRPISLPSEMELVDIITMHKNIAELETLPKETILQVMTDFFNSGSDEDLNLQLLNPAFFKEIPKQTAETNRSRIRKFYLDLIRYTHFE